MNKNRLLKKGIVLTVIVMLIGLAFTSASLSERNISTQNITSNNTELSLSSDDDTILEYDTGAISERYISTRNMNANTRGLSLGLYGYIRIKADDEALHKPIEPLSGYRLVPVNISYAIDGLLANELLPIIKKKWSHMPIHLSIESIPEWADAIILPDIVYPEISTEYKSDTTNLFISIVNKSAHAYSMEYITLKAQTEPLIGPLGIITWINPTQGESNIYFTPDYFSLISVTPENDTVQIPPGQVVKLLITIKNLGNAKTQITIDKLEYPDDWVVNIISNTVIDINQERQVSLTLRSPQNFIGNQTIRIALTPSYTYDPENRGVTEFISILAYEQYQS